MVEEIEFLPITLSWVTVIPMITSVFGVGVGALTERIAVKNCMSNIFSSCSWNFLTKIVVSFSVVSFFKSSACVHEENIFSATFHVFDGQCHIDDSGMLDIWSLSKLVIYLVSFSFGAWIGSALQPVGLTGGIACGKTTVSTLLQKGETDFFEIIDVDGIAHDVLDPIKMGKDSAYTKLVDAFGEGILEEKSETTNLPKIDRAKLGAIIFADRSKRKVLNGITHPLIIKIMLKSIFHSTVRLRSLRKIKHGPKASLTCVDIPLLFEGGFFMRMLFSLKISVSCAPTLQLERLQKRNPDLSLKQCKERIASQMPVQQKNAMSDFVVLNDGNMDDLVREVHRIKQEILPRVEGWNVRVDQLVFLQGLIMVLLQSLMYVLP